MSNARTYPKPETAPRPPRSPRRSRRLLLPAALLAAMVAPPGPSAAAPPGNAVTVRFLNAGPKEPAIQPRSGWPLNLEIELHEGSFKGFYRLPIGLFPYQDFRTFAYMGDPASAGHVDGGPKPGVATLRREGSRRALLQPPTIAFTPGITLPAGGGPEARPRVPGFHEESRKVVLIPVGPPLGTKKEGYGYGPSSRLPGLVLLADGGPGLVTDQNFSRGQPLRSRNLAGFFQSISYQLKDSTDRTTLLAHMNVPPDLFSPVMQVDSALSEPCPLAPGLLRLRSAEAPGQRLALAQAGPAKGSSPRIEGFEGALPLKRPPLSAGEGNSLVRVDGGPQRCEWYFLPYVGFSPREVLTLRAFVVQGLAPEELADLDGDGVVGRKDAIKAGLRVLSSEAAYRIRSVQAFAVPFDFDGNGMAIGPGGGDLSPAELTPPPR